ncbi:5-methylcytosine rRNA methyltransferase NSUN4 [Cimex lectularius]|uniref:NOL1/NOP2/Sun domain family member 4 n=1 Tax=Cimex lectularius TaxID=79782 RepID=A0A8I6TFP2_CIMLE|nr:5-methylcytosine rRNA methyltransferase NSUN4 [Cimex lectularius]
MMRKIDFIFKFARNKGVNYSQKRWKNGPNHWSVLLKKKSASDKALEHFDDFYKNVFNKAWPSVRVALLSQNKHIAVVNNFSDTENIIPSLENLGAINIKKLFEIEAERIKSEGHKRRRRSRTRPQNENLEMKMEKISEEKLDEELSSIYPEVPEVKDETRSVQVDDDNRLIDPEVGKLSGSLYEFVPTSRLKGKEDWVLESQHYQYYESGTDFPIRIIEQENITFPPHLSVYTFETGNISKFPMSKKGDTGVSDYYLLDGGSLLPVLALGLRPGDCVLDMCSSPGGKSFLCLQTLNISKLVANDVSVSRLNRVRRVMQEFFYDFHKKLENGELELSCSDGRDLDSKNIFDKILVDAPCTNDRHSLSDPDNNIFKPARIKERIKIPEVQSELLTSALKLVKKGGTVVYSTCSLSPIQNDGVVHMALKKIWEDTDYKIAVVDMRRALEPTEIMYKYSHNIGLRYGHLVIPYLPCNFGPMYFCKFIKVG